jgi:hypothetical protein
MPTLRKIHGGMFAESKRVVLVAGEPAVKQVTCCCAAPASTRKGCSIVAGNKTPCRCDCHSKRI